MPKNTRRETARKRQSSSARRRASQRYGIQRARGATWRVSVVGALVTLGIVAIAALFFSRMHAGAGPIATATAPSVATAAPTLARRIDGIPCNDENITYHVHAHLQITYVGHNVVVPADIGIDDNTCVYYLHTHDNSGELHIEAPKHRRFSLGDFFDIWRQPLSTTHVASFALHPGQRVRAFLNGKRYAGDPRSIELLPHRLIALEVGPPFIRPSGFDFQGD